MEFLPATFVRSRVSAFQETVQLPTMFLSTEKHIQPFRETIIEYQDTTLDNFLYAHNPLFFNRHAKWSLQNQEMRLIVCQKNMVLKGHHFFPMSVCFRFQHHSPMILCI